ncbi:MAG: hypothetical protein NVS1B10_02580 [Candidatus Saccharimonadales bacterium]
MVNHETHNLSFPKQTYDIANDPNATNRERFSEFLEGLSDYAASPPGKDPRISAFGHAVIEEFHDPNSTRFVKFLDEFLISGSLRQNEPLENKYDRLLRGCQRGFLNPTYQEDASNPKFPEEHLDPAAWRKGFDWILDNGEVESNFMYDLLVREVSSNIPQRYVSIPIIVGLFRALHPDRFIEPPKIGDAGCSQNLGLIKLAGNSSFGEVTITNGSSTNPKILEDKTELINSFVDPNFEIGDSWGFDTMRPWDPGAKDWAKACSGYPSEFLDKKRAEEYDELFRHQGDAEVGFNEWDITKQPKPGELDVEEKSLDIVFASNVLYLIRPKNRLAAVENLKRLVKDDGIVVFLEFAKANRSRLPKQNKQKFKELYNHRAFVTDLTDKHKIAKEFLVYEGGRCRTAKLGRKAITMMRELDN